MVEKVSYFIIIVVAWVGAWGLIDGTITYFLPDSKIVWRMLVYAILLIITLILYAWFVVSEVPIPEEPRSQIVPQRSQQRSQQPHVVL